MVCGDGGKMEQNVVFVLDTRHVNMGDCFVCNGLFSV